MDSAEARRLIAALDAGLAEVYPPDQRFGPNLRPAHLADGQGEFFVAREAGEAVGCGAIRILDPTTAEVKRMYVDPARRGQGIGRAILGRLEETAGDIGVTRLVLETGIHQAAAIALYRAAGFVEVGCWGEYASSPSSICFAKSLD